MLEVQKVGEQHVSVIELFRAWRAAARSLCEDTPREKAIWRSYCEVLSLVHLSELSETSYAITAILHTLLRVQGIESVMCLGEIAWKQRYCSHAWLEIEGKVYDVAISDPHFGHWMTPPIFGGCDLFFCEPALIRYGVVPLIGFDRTHTVMRNINVKEYMVQTAVSDERPHGLVDIVYKITQQMGIPIKKEDIMNDIASMTFQLTFHLGEE